MQNHQLPETFKMCDTPEELLTPKMVQAKTHSNPIKESLDEEYDVEELFSSGCLLMEDIVSENEAHLSSALVKHKRWNKKRKHNKDGNTTRIKYEGWWESEFNTHKFRRSLKVFTEDEWFEKEIPWYEDPYELDYCNYTMECCNHEWRNYVDRSGKALLLSRGMKEYELWEEQVEVFQEIS